MVQNVEDEGDGSVIAMLDTGCNNTCHGSRSMDGEILWRREDEFGRGAGRWQVQRSWWPCECEVQAHDPFAHEDFGW